TRIRKASGGNPFHALEIARAFPQAGHVPSPLEELPIPETLAGLINERIRVFGADTLEVLAVAAMAADPTLDLLARASGKEGEAIAAALAPARASGVVEVRDGIVAYAHPLMATGIVDSLSSERKRLLHRRLAASVVDEDRRAWHLAFGT